MSRALSRSASNSGRAAAALARLLDEFRTDMAQRLLERGIVQRPVGIFLELRRGGVNGHRRSSSGMPIGGPFGHAGQDLGHVPHLRVRAAARQLAGHVHQAAEVARPPGAGPRGDHVIGLALDDAVGQLAIFHREGPAETAADVGVLHFDEIEPAHRAEQGARLRP